MHLFDVEEAIDVTDFRGLRQAFGILIDYPHKGHLEGARTAAKPIDLFDKVISGLEFDQAEMHEPLCRSIERVVPIPLGAAATFSHGAIVAAEYSAHWHGLFRDHAAHADAA